MSVSLIVNLSIHLFIYPFICLSNCKLVYLSFCTLSVWPFVRKSVCPFVLLSFCPFVRLYIICLSIHEFLCASLQDNANFVNLNHSILTMASLSKLQKIYFYVSLCPWLMCDLVVCLFRALGLYVKNFKNQRKEGKYKNYFF